MKCSLAMYLQLVLSFCFDHLKDVLSCWIILIYAALQIMVRDSKCCIMKSGRSMSLTLIIFLMSSTPRMVVRGWLLFWCICKYIFIHYFLIRLFCSVNWVCSIFLYIIFNGYRSDVEEGGETIFPDANVNASSLPWYNELSECAKRGLSVKPKMGDALLFWSMKPDATLDPLSLHG